MWLATLKTFERSDRSSYLAVNIAIDKAYTAASFGLVDSPVGRPFGRSRRFELTACSRVMAAAGGFPSWRTGRLLAGSAFPGKLGAGPGKLAKALRNFPSDVDTIQKEARMKAIGYKTPSPISAADSFVDIELPKPEPGPRHPRRSKGHFG